MQDKKFQDLDLKEIASHTKIITQFVDELSAPSNNKLEIVQILFGQLFKSLSFDFDAFLANMQLTALQKSRYISYLLYALYYYEIPLAALKSIDDAAQIEYFLLAMAAESLEPRKIHAILKKLPLTNQIRLISYCSIYIREGTRNLLYVFSLIYQDDPLWNGFLKKLQTKYYNPFYLSQILQENRSTLSLSVSSVIDKLDKHAEEQIIEIRNIIPLLIHSIIQSPLAIFEALKKNNLSNESIQKKLISSHKDLESLFGKYRFEIYTIEELKAFFRYFGLKDHILNTPQINNPASKAALSELLKKLLELFLNPSMIPEAHASPLVLFVLNLCQELHTFHREPNLYYKGLESIVFALSTRGNQLTESPWLYSVLRGVESVNDHLQTKGTVKPRFNPIVIFDQASQALYQKNSKGIQALANEYKRDIWHLSSTQTLKLAQKLGIKDWIETSSSTQFGYGGARNCALLLAPVLAEAFRQGVHSLEEILQSKDEKLKTLYNAAVLGKQGNDVFIHLGEDDVAIPIGNIFSDIRSGAINKELYFNRYTKCCGRTTHEIYPYLDFKTVLEMPLQCFYRWKSDSFEGGMKGLLTKPKFCLPISLGNEELHVILPHMDVSHFQQANEHLAGTHFPHNNIPISPWDGLLEILQVQVPYRFKIAMTSIFIDSSNKYGQNIFPWNDVEIRKSESLHSLQELWDYATTEDVIKELKKRFWNNVESTFKEENNCLLFRQVIERLIELDLSVIAPSELIEFYKSMQHEAKIFQAFIAEILAQRKLQNPNFVQSSQQKIEETFKIIISQSILSVGLLELVNAIENFGHTPLS